MAAKGAKNDKKSNSSSSSSSSYYYYSSAYYSDEPSSQDKDGDGVKHASSQSASAFPGESASLRSKPETGGSSHAEKREKRRSIVLPSFQTHSILEVFKAQDEDASLQFPPGSPSAGGETSADEGATLASAVAGMSYKGPLYIRAQRNLYLRVSEARGLKRNAKNVSSYVVVDLGSGVMVRTQTIFKNPEPLFGEEFNFELPLVWTPRVSLEVYSKGKASDEVLGVVNLESDDLVAARERASEDWYPLVMPTVSKKNFISGALHMQIVVKPASAGRDGSLVIRIVEAKNLTVRGVTGAAKPYVDLYLGEERQRSTTVRATSEATFDQEFSFVLRPDSSSSLLVSVFHEKKLGANVFMGDVSITVNSLEPFVRHDKWYSLQNKFFATADGVAELAIMKDIRKRRASVSQQQPPKNLATTAAAAAANPTSPRGIAAPRGGGGGGGDSALPAEAAGSAPARSPTAASRSPSGDETGALSCGASPSTGTPALSESALLGATSVSSSPIVLRQEELAARQKLALQKVDSDSDDESSSRRRISLSSTGASAASQGLGDLRVKFTFNDIDVLPFEAYEQLLSTLAEHAAVLRSLMSNTKNRDMCSRSLMLSMVYHGSSLPFLARVLTFEVDDTSNTAVLFRGNTLGSKATDHLMKIYGGAYLLQTLQPHIQRVYRTAPSFEIDPERLDVVQQEKNATALVTFVSEVLSTIFATVDEFPMPLRRLFAHLRERVQARFPHEEDVRYTAVSGFVFLRFFCPAIMGPKIFGLCDDHPQQTVARSLVLAAKVVMQLGNLVRFGDKERHMARLNPLLEFQEPRMKAFLDAISSLPPGEQPLHADEARSAHVSISQLYPKSEAELHAALLHKELLVHWDALKDDDGSAFGPAVTEPIMRGMEEIALVCTAAKRLAARRDRGLSVWHYQQQRKHDLMHDHASQSAEKAALMQSMVRLLSDGAVFIKHNSRGKKVRRFVWCDLEAARLFWEDEVRAGKAQPRKKNMSRVIALADLIDVARGQTTPAFQKSGSLAHAYLSFSLVSVFRTLDLEAESEAQREGWVEALTYIVRELEFATKQKKSGAKRTE